MLTQDEINRVRAAAGAKPISDVVVPRTSLKERIAPPPPPETFMQKAGGVAKSVVNAVTSSERALGHTIGDIASVNTYGDDIKESQQKMADSDLAYIKALKANRDKAVAAKQDTTRFDNALKNFHTSTGQSMLELFPSLNKTDAQVLGEIAGTTLDLLSSGTYGQAAKGAQGGKLLVKSGGLVEKLATKVGVPTSAKIATTAVKGAAQATLGQTLKKIGTKTAIRTGVGAGTGYGYDVSRNLQEGKTGLDAATPGLGTAFGAAIPLAIGSIEAGAAITKSVAPRFINSLIKPKQADFSYGKDPGRTVSQMGITGNNLDDFAKNIGNAKDGVGEKIGAIYSSPKNASLRIDVSDEISKIDDAIEQAAKGGKNNQNIVNQLQNIKDSLLYNHTVDEAGTIVRGGSEASGYIDKIVKTTQNAADSAPEVANKYGMSGLIESVQKDISANASAIGLSDDLLTKIDDLDPSAFKTLDEFKAAAKKIVDETPRDLSGLNPMEAFKLKQDVAKATQFTGRPSDDKAVNSILKNIYGGLKEKLNSTVGVNNPELPKLNQQYADLTSAELATLNRDAIVKRSSLINLKTGSFATGAGVVTAILSGGTAIPVVLASLSAGVLEKALETTAVKSRIAAWLGAESPTVIQKVFTDNPAVKEVIYRAIPKIASQLRLPDQQ